MNNDALKSAVKSLGEWIAAEFPDSATDGDQALFKANYALGQAVIAGDAVAISENLDAVFNRLIAIKKSRPDVADLISEVKATLSDPQPLPKSRLAPSRQESTMPWSSPSKSPK
jgi:hypothetical protein